MRRASFHPLDSTRFLGGQGDLPTVTASDSGKPTARGAGRTNPHPSNRRVVAQQQHSRPEFGMSPGRAPVGPC